ncbi:MAG: relaxase domain-containing protein [Planctomycetales bacterium]|nr:relaxase domain-containing protein [Planctomycetales bacterium]
MLRIRQNTHVDGAKSYYSTADYYTEGQELTGRWRGKGAALLGLEGDVQKSEWDALCDNLDPRTGRRLTKRTDADRTIGYDFNFHVPKSLSLLYSLTRDERLLDAFREAVDVTMQDMEAEMAARVRKNGRNENRTTGNMVWGEFIHFTSRPVGGVPDPHLHAHCFVFSETFDHAEEIWKAGQFRDLKRDAPFFEAVFHSHLAGRLAQRGLPIERTKNGWEIAGVGQPLVEKFSRRTRQIEEKAREKGITDVRQKAELGAKTRERKANNLSFPQLQESWRGRMTPQEQAALKNLTERIGGEAEPADATSAGRALDYALQHSFERKSVVPQRQLLALALKQSVGQAAVADVLDSARRHESLVVGLRGGRSMATTRGVLLEETKLVRFAREGRGRCAPLGQGTRPLRREWLNDSQRRAVAHLLGSRDRVILLAGRAGVGKTTLMQEAVEAIEETGKKVLAFAPSAEASRGVLRGDGFSEAETVARLLVDEKLQHEAAGQVLWIDEAGLLGTRTMSQVFDLAEKIDARVLLTGDRKQHGSVERGAALRLLEEEAGLVPAEVKDIQRQSGEYKEAVRALGDGRVGEGFDRLDALGWIQELPAAERYAQLAADYAQAVGEGKTTLVVSPVHAEGDRITRNIRRALMDAGMLGREEQEVLKLQNAQLTEAERGDALHFLPGDVVQFHQNAKGYRRGQKVGVGLNKPLPLEHAQRFQVFHQERILLAAGDLVRITHNGQTADGLHRLDNGMVFQVRGFDETGDIVLMNGWRIAKDWGHLDYGYVVTSHASQGKTVDRVFIGQSAASLPATSREQFYVSASRARERMTVYTDDKDALREAVGKGDARLSATELVNGAVRRQTEAEREPIHSRDEMQVLQYER